MKISCQVTTNEAMQNGVRRLVLSLPVAASFCAGQYLLLTVGDRAFPFSIANAPGGKHLELHIKATKDSPDSALIEQFLNDHPPSLTIEFPWAVLFEPGTIAACNFYRRRDRYYPNQKPV